MKTLKLLRFQGDQNQSMGALIVQDEQCRPLYVRPCIERGYRDNEQNVSNVPANIYPIVFEYSPKFQQNLWELKDVPNRSECKIHAANFWFQLNGCMSPGMSLGDINEDGYIDVKRSVDAINELHRVMDGVTETTIEIIDML